jgi:hypothetical protein
MRLVRKRWIIENWHWIRHTHLHEDDRHYHGNGLDTLNQT